MKLFGRLLSAKKDNVSGSVIFGRKREIDVKVNNNARKVVDTKDEVSLSTLFMGIKGLNTSNRDVFSNRVQTIRNSQREGVQSRCSCLERGLKGRLFGN